jgi:hypothetical protein
VGQHPGIPGHHDRNTQGKTAGVDFSATMGDGATPSLAYDDNGNIAGMKQMAWQIGGSNSIRPLIQDAIGVQRDEFPKMPYDIDALELGSQNKK